VRSLFTFIDQARRVGLKSMAYDVALDFKASGDRLDKRGKQIESLAKKSKRKASRG
jgi:hypothetical protein